MLRSRARRLNQEKWRRWRCPGLDIDPQAFDPAVRTALTRALESTKGTPRFVELVQRFQLQDRAPELVAMALADPEGNLGKEAARLGINLVWPVTGRRWARRARRRGPCGTACRCSARGRRREAEVLSRLGWVRPLAGVEPEPGVAQRHPLTLHLWLDCSNPPSRVKTCSSPRRPSSCCGAADHAAAREVLRDFALDSRAAPRTCVSGGSRVGGHSRRRDTIAIF